MPSPSGGGAFEYQSDLHTDADPDHDGVARLLDGKDDQVRTLTLGAGRLNAFKGKKTLHRVTPCVGPLERHTAVFSYYQRPGVRFAKEDQVGFCGRAV